MEKFIEESKRSPSSDAGDASKRDATQSAGAGPTPGRSADASHSSLRQHGHLYEEPHRLDLSQGCISCGILVSGIRARGVSLEHMENMDMFSCSPTLVRSDSQRT